MKGSTFMGIMAAVFFLLGAAMAKSDALWLGCGGIVMFSAFGCFALLELERRK